MTEVFPETLAEPDVAAMATGFGIALHTAGLPVGPDRCERLARAVTVMGAILARPVTSLPRGALHMT